MCHTELIYKWGGRRDGARPSNGKSFRTIWDKMSSNGFLQVNLLLSTFWLSVKWGIFNMQTKEQKYSSFSSAVQFRVGVEKGSDTIKEWFTLTHNKIRMGCLLWIIIKYLILNWILWVMLNPSWLTCEYKIPKLYARKW